MISTYFEVFHRSKIKVMVTFNAEKLENTGSTGLKLDLMVLEKYVTPIKFGVRSQ
jgi:hypothetical protein